MNGEPSLVPTATPPNISPARAVWLSKATADRRVPAMAIRLAVALASADVKPPLEIDLDAMAKKLRASKVGISNSILRLGAFGYVEIEQVRRNRMFIRLARPR